MILAVTMNPSVDISYPIPHLKLDDVNRVESVRKTAGGKGLNVARVARLIGEEVLATGVIGGTLGEYIMKELEKDHIQHDFHEISQESRNCIAILHDGKQTEILESGPVLTEENGDAFLEKYETLLSEASVVTISGSLPKGLPANFYQKMVELGSEKEIPVIVDTSGKPLRQVVAHRISPYAIKPNISEMSQLLGMEVDHTSCSLKRALSNEMFEGIEWIFVSLGKEGAFVKHRSEYYQVTIPRIEAVNPVGSGDATVAGFAAAVNRNQPVPLILKTAMAAGMLNAMEEGTGFINVSRFKRIFQSVRVRKLEI